MATRTLLPKPTVVYVVAVMTIDTSPPGGVHLVTGARMARHARELCVSTVDYESRFLMMIKVPDAPVAHVVTDITSRPQFSFVSIVFAMTTHTRTRRILEPLGRVAALAGHLEVTAQQRKACFRMIEANGLPVGFVMAAFATRALLTRMNIIFPMA